MNASNANMMLVSENLVGYDPANTAAFQWPIEESFLPELTAAMEANGQLLGHLVLNGQPEPIVGYFKSIDGVMHFQLKLNAQVAESIIPPVPKHVRDQMLKQA